MPRRRRRLAPRQGHVRRCELMAPCSPARVVGLTAQALLGLALALTNPAARAAEQQNHDAPAVSISQTKLKTPVFDGEPKLEPIAGTTLLYVVNSATPIILINTMTQRYYAVENAVWFKSASPRGPWVRRSQRARGALHDPAELAASLRHRLEDLRRRRRHGLRRLHAALRTWGDCDEGAARDRDPRVVRRCIAAGHIRLDTRLVHTQPRSRHCHVRSGHGAGPHRRSCRHDHLVAARESIAIASRFARAWLHKRCCAFPR